MYDQEITEYYRNSITIIHNHKIHYSEVMVGGQLSFSVWFSVSKMFMMNVPAEIVTQGVDVMLAVWAGYSTVGVGILALIRARVR